MCRSSAAPCEDVAVCNDQGVCGANPIRPMHFPCRPTNNNPCDIAEVCDGSSSLCPAIDVKEPDATACQTALSEEGTCKVGVCVKVVCGDGLVEGSEDCEGN